MTTKEVLYQTFHTKFPGRERLRKTAEGRLKFLIREGWHEVAREPGSADTVRIRLEREGATKPLKPLRKPSESLPRRRGDRGWRGDRGGRGGGRPSGPPPAGRG